MAGAVPLAGDRARLPAFSACEARFRKAPDANALLFSVPARSSLLLPLLRPASHAYAPRDWRWLRLLQAVARVPSRRVDELRVAVRQALRLLAAPGPRRRLEAALSPLLDALDALDARAGAADTVPEQFVLGLQLKDRVAAFLREWIADPVEGFVLSKDHVVAGLCLDDVVATPAGTGYLRAFRREDGFCTVVYPWGHGFVHLRQVERADAALRRQLRKRRAGEFVALEHQHLFEGVGADADADAAGDAAGDVDAGADGAVYVSGVDPEAYKALLESIEDGGDQRADSRDLQPGVRFLRRVQALATKTRELRASKRPRLGATDDEQDDGDGDGGEDGDGDGDGDRDGDGDGVDERMGEDERKRAADERRGGGATTTMGR